MASDRSSLRSCVAPWSAGTLVVLVLLGLWQGHGYWEFSDGVYSLSARQLLDGHGLYTDVAGAQPPPLFWVGAAALAVHDGADTIRVAMALLQAVTSWLVVVTVWRLTGRRGAALAPGGLALVTPWALREHAQYLPETIAAPLVLGTVLAAARERTAALAGALAVLALSLKVALLLPALGAILLGRRAGRALATAGALTAVGLVLFLLLYGGDGWDNVVTAQRQAGGASVSYVAGLWGQGLWNLLPLLVPALLLWPGRGRLQDEALARCLAGALAGALLLFLTLFKHGSYLTMLLVLEPLVVCLAVPGALFALEDRGARRRGPVLAALGLAALLGVAQVGSLLVRPGDPALFTRPGADSGGERVLSSAEVDARVRALRACSPGVAVAGPPYLAFRAGRRVAGDQPDQFIIRAAPVLARFRDAADAEPAPCGQPGG